MRFISHYTGPMTERLSYETLKRLLTKKLSNIEKAAIFFMLKNTALYAMDNNKPENPHRVEV